MNIKEYKDNLLNIDLKSFLEEYTEKDVFRLRNLYPEDYKLLAEQIKLYPKAKEKLPEFTSNYCYLTTKSYEQASSETLAKHKAALFNSETLIDLTGGLGVDDWAFSKSFNKVISVDTDSELNSLVRINFEKLKISNIERVNADANDFIKNKLSADLIYIDADRRAKTKKSITLEGSEPPMLNMLERLFEISENILLKLSPLIDITYLTKSLHHIEKIQVVSLYNEVKEVLVHLNSNYTGEIKLKAVDISNNGVREYSADFDDNSKPEISIDGKYFYEPANCMIKGGLVNSYASSLNLETISKNGIYLLSNAPINNFFGRSFIVIEKLPFSKSRFAKYLKENKILLGNLSKRNFPFTVNELKKLTKLKDGGDDYFFFTQDIEKQKLIYHCKKL
jgi:hypothetical protein